MQASTSGWGGNMYFGTSPSGTSSTYTRMSIQNDGNIYLANIDSSLANASMFIGHNGRVGIGTTAPVNKLDVEGAAVIGATYSGTNTAPANGLLVEGNVSIGTTNVSDRLTIAGGNVNHLASGVVTLEGSLVAGNGYDVYVVGDYAYFTAGGNGLKIFNISNRATPTLEGTLDTTGDADKVHVAGRYAYLADGDEGLRVIDVSNPSSPSLVGTYNSAGSARGIYASGKYVYLGDGATGLLTIDVSDPSTPSLVSTYNTSGNATDIFVSGKYAYVADGATGLVIVDISNPTSPSLAGSYNTSGTAVSVYVSGKYAYIADSDTGMIIVDISNPASPSLTGSYNTAGSAVHIQVAGNYAYIADSSYFIIVDVTNPGSPSLVTSYTTGGSYTNAVFVNGKYVYTIGNWNYLYIFDINGLETPTLSTGSLKSNYINVSENMDIGNDLFVKNGLKVGSGGIYSDGSLYPTKKTADPCASGITEGGIFYNDTSNYYCYCDGTNDVKLHDPATACF